MDQIIEYIKQLYDPISIIVYGSYADGTNHLNSDFDALVISRSNRTFHDTAFVDGTQLDVFIYPESHFDGNYDCIDFIQIFDGKIVLDTESKGAALKDHILSYMKNRPQKTDAEIRGEIDWCAKMFARTKRHDVEGMFRWHWVLTDSLEIFCDAVHYPYLGPKKALRWMEAKHPKAFTFYKKALIDFSAESLSDWISYLENMIEKESSV